MPQPEWQSIDLFFFFFSIKILPTQDSFTQYLSLAFASRGVTPIEARSLVKITDHTRNRTLGHMRSNNGLCLPACTVRVTIFSIGSKFQPV